MSPSGSFPLVGFSGARKMEVRINEDRRTVEIG